jgi:predicted transposase/invertase (TIGR01784 family)
MEILFKHSRDGAPSLAAKDYQDVFLACIAKLGDDYLHSMLSYIDAIENEKVGEKLNKFVEEVYRNKQDIIMTYGQVRTQEARQEGIEIGLLKGLTEGIQTRNIAIARNMLKKGFDLTSIQELTGLTLDELQILK